MSRLLRFIARIGAIFTIVAACGAAAAWWWLARPLALPSSPYVFDVKSGATLRAVARDLAAAGVIPAATPLIVLARVRNVDRGIKAGNYEITAGVSMFQLLNKLTQGDVTDTALTLVEGATFADLRRALVANPASSKRY
jgi:UPF0755 protein